MSALAKAFDPLLKVAARFYQGALTTELNKMGECKMLLKIAAVFHHGRWTSPIAVVILDVQTRFESNESNSSFDFSLFFDYLLFRPPIRGFDEP